MLRVGVIGVGAMGRNHARVYADMDSVRLVAVADVNVQTAQKIAEHYHAAAYTDYREMLDKEALDAVSVVVPTTLHRPVTVDVMQRGVSVLLEKPIASTLEDGQAIIDCASQSSGTLAIGHIERFNPAMVALKKRLDADELGKIFEIRARRLGPIPGRIEDVGVVIDVATHDIDLMRWLVPQPIERVHAEIQQRLNPKHEDMFFGLIHFANGVTGLLDVSWLVPTKIRQFSIVGERGMFVVDTIAQELYFYENEYVMGLTPTNTPIIEGNMTRIKIEKKEPLRVELENFLAVVSKKPGEIVTADQAQGNLKVALEFIARAQKDA